MLRPIACLAALVLPVSAPAHPHVFVDTDLRLIVDGAGMVSGVEMTWRYDDFFTLLILEDEGLDPDGDGALTAAEEARLLGFDLEVWPVGFEGDLYAYAGDTKLDLPRPEPVSATVEDGRIVSVQRRAIPPVPVTALRLRQFDPTYYVAYSVASIAVDGAACEPRIVDPDPSLAEEALSQSLEEAGEDQFAILELGTYFAQTISFSCASSS